MGRVVAIAVVLAALQGCALTDATLDVGLDPSRVSAGPLSDVSRQTFVLEDFDDVRSDKERVGYKKNSFGARLADITTEQPVTEIVKEAIDGALIANGHAVGAGGVSVAGTVNQFWVDSDMNFTHIELMCNIETELSFTDMATDTVIHQGVYRGSFSEKRQTGMESNYRSVIAGAIEKLVDELVFDEELAEALDGP